MPRKRTTEQFIQDSILIHGNKYDYSKVEYINSTTKIKIICKLHGEFEQEPTSHLRGRGCPKCGKIKMANKTRNDINTLISRAKEIHNKYDYSKVEYRAIDKNVIIICPEHGPFEQSLLRHINQRQGCPQCAGVHKYTNGQFINRAKEIHNNKYDYSKVEYINSKTKIKIICPEHGEFMQEPFAHLRGAGCKSCVGLNTPTTKEWIKKAQIMHGNKYDYSSSQYINSKTKIKIICPKHGEFEQLPENHIKGSCCPKCYSSSGENIIYNILNRYKIILEEQKTFNDLIFKKKLKYDFYLPTKNLLIEYNGEQHYKWIKVFDKTYHDFLESKHRDWLKRKYAKDNNICLLTIPYWDKDNIENILIDKLNLNGENYDIKSDF